jgi:chitinase
VWTAPFPVKWRTAIEMHTVTAIHINTFLSPQRSWLSAAAVIIAAAALPARADDSAPAWQVDVYYAVGSVVSYRGHEYQARVSQVDFHDSDWSPAVSSLWKELDTPTRLNFHAPWFARVANTESRCAMAWDAKTIYTTGGVASVDGVDYEANWWTQGESPATHNGTEQGQPWTRVDSCADRSRRATAESNSTQSTAPGSKSTLQAQAEGHTG